MFSSCFRQLSKGSKGELFVKGPQNASSPTWIRIHGPGTEMKDRLFSLIAKSVACIPLSLTIAYALLECVNSSLNHKNIINKMGMPATNHMHNDVAEVDSFLSGCCQAHSSLRVSMQSICLALDVYA